MAKKKAGRGDFNMSQAIRDELQANPEISLKDCLAAIQSKHPGLSVNPNSFGVAFSNQRAKLGLKKRRGGKTVRRRKPGAVRTAVATQAAKPVNLDVLQAARRYVAVVGDAETAIAAVRQLQTLQIG